MRALVAVLLVGCSAGPSWPPPATTFEGPLEASLTAVDYGLSFPCDGTATVHVDAAASPQAEGDLTCVADAFGEEITVEGVLEGDFLNDEDPDLEGTVTVDVVGDPTTDGWDGFIEDEYLSGQFGGAMVLQGYAITYEGSFLATSTTPTE